MRTFHCLVDHPTNSHQLPFNHFFLSKGLVKHYVMFPSEVRPGPNFLLLNMAAFFVNLVNVGLVDLSSTLVTFGSETQAINALQKQIEELKGLDFVVAAFVLFCWRNEGNKIWVEKKSYCSRTWIGTVLADSKQEDQHPRCMSSEILHWCWLSGVILLFWYHLSCSLFFWLSLWSCEV